MLWRVHLRRIAVRMLLSVLLAIVTLTASAPSDTRAKDSAVFEPASCPFALPSGLVDGDGVTCGYLTTPMFHGEDSVTTALLAVARLSSTLSNPAPEPLVLLLGGPGQELETVLPAFAPGAAISYRSLLERQDVILLEQRGIGYSEPSLACPFDTVGGVDASEILLSTDDPVVAFGDCAEGLRAEGIDLEAFDSIQSAADVDALRRALGYERIDLLGISYGSRMVLTVMRDFPASVRSAVLASPLPLQANVVAGQVIGFDNALDRLLASCAARVDCADRFPDVDSALSDAVDRLTAEPFTVSGAHPITGEPVEILVDGTVFLEILYVATFIGPLLQFVPALISGVVEGNNVVLETLAPYTQILTTGVSLGANYVINCNEEFGQTDAGVISANVAKADVRPELRSGDFAGGSDTFPICNEIGVTPAAPTENAAVASDIPTLIVSGEYDPITPPVYGDLAATTLPNSVIVVIDGVSHDPLSTSGSCGFAIVADFLTDPTRAPESSCADDTPIEFFIGAE